MSAKPRLRAVAAKTVPPLYAVRPEWAHPHNEHNRAAYVAAVAYLRRGPGSRWVLDNSSAPSWRAQP